MDRGVVSWSGFWSSELTSSTQGDTSTKREQSGLEFPWVDRDRCGRRTSGRHKCRYEHESSSSSEWPSIQPRYLSSCNSLAQSEVPIVRGSCTKETSGTRGATRRIEDNQPTSPLSQSLEQRQSKRASERANYPSSDCRGSPSAIQ